MRLALKAQSACLSTLDALAKLHQPREQTVKHVHVNQGGQAVVADHFHQNTGGEENGKSVKQSDATGPAGTSAALPGPDALGEGVPIASRKRQEAMPNARRHKPGAPKGNRNAWKHGGRSAQALAASRYVRMLAKLFTDQST